MADYSSLFGGVQAPNILNGAMAGLRMPYEIQGADQRLQSQGIQNMSDLSKLQMMQESENPRARAVNALAQHEAEAQDNPDLIAQKVATTLAGSQAGEMEAQGKIRAEQQKYIYDLGQEIQQRAKNGKVYDPMSESSQTWWKDKVAEAKRLKIPMPDMPDMGPNGDSPMFKAIVAKSNALAVSPAFIQAMAVAQEQTHSHLTGIEKQGESSKEVARIQAAKAAEVANIAAEAGVKRAEIAATGRDPKTIEADLIRSAREGHPPSDLVLQMAADQAFNAAMKTGEGIDQVAAKNRASYRDEWISGWISKMKSQVQSVAPQGGGQGSAAVSAAKPQPNVSKAAYDALPSGAKYWWNGQQVTKK